MNTEGITCHTFPNGLRAVHLPAPGVAEYFGVATRVGSRDESPDIYGMAHFVEHTIFKGTHRRKVGHIINRMESVGGELNAYTTKEKTVVYSAFPSGNAPRAIELIGDLLSHSVFPGEELDKEREVVAEEIASYLDIPSEAVYDDFEDMIFRGSGLGHNILGTLDTLRTFDSARCREFMSRFYTAPAMVAFYTGSESSDKVFREIERHFADLPTHSSERFGGGEAKGDAFREVRTAGVHQAHTVMGMRTGGIYSDDIYATSLLSNILGGPGMNSLLNVSLRERSGLVYSVESTVSRYTDVGLLSIYFGCDAADVEKCERKVKREIARLADSPVGERKLAAYITQYTGQLTMARDNKESAVLAVAKQMLYHGKVRPFADTLAGVRGVDAAALRDAACRILDMNVLTIRGGI